MKKRERGLESQRHRCKRKEIIFSAVVLRQESVHIRRCVASSVRDEQAYQVWRDVVEGGVGHMQGASRRVLGGDRSKLAVLSYAVMVEGRALCEEVGHKF